MAGLSICDTGRLGQPGPGHPVDVDGFRVSRPVGATGGSPIRGQRTEDLVTLRPPVARDGARRARQPSAPSGSDPTAFIRSANSWTTSWTSGGQGTLLS